MAHPRPRLGVSACLLGAQVRFDGGHSRDRFVERLAAHADVVPVCPEVELGLGSPRESLRLVSLGRPEVALVAPRSQRDLSGPMRHYAREKADALARAGIDGYIVKKGSPSCGRERVRVYHQPGIPTRTGRGLFAEALMERLPLLPVEEDGRLNDLALREHFLVRLFAHARLRELLEGPFTPRDLVRFHANEKLLLLAHSPDGLVGLGRLVAQAGRLPREELIEGYREGYQRCLATPPARGRHVNVLQHMAGYFKDQPHEARVSLAEAIAGFEAGTAPLDVPLALLRHEARRRRLAYLDGQVYFSPYPSDRLREHAP